VLGRHQRDLRDLYRQLTAAFPSIPTQPPQGSGGTQDSYFHLAVITLEWQALEELIGSERAMAVEKFKRTDHYTALYGIVLDNRSTMEAILKRSGVKW
jgi:hypothetical protein